MVTNMTRSLENRTEVSKTANAIVELMTTSSCPVPELNPALAYLVDNRWVSPVEHSILNAAAMTHVALNGGCNPLQSRVEDLLFNEDSPDKLKQQEMMSALVPVSFDLTFSPSDESTANSVSTKVKSISETHKLPPLKVYSLIANSFTMEDFDAKLKQYEMEPESKPVVNVKKITSAFDVLNYAYGGVKGQVTEYLSEVSKFKMLNPIPMTDAWNKMRYDAKHKIMTYKHLVDNGTLSMETAHDELWAWLKHASILFVLTKAGVCAGASLLLWMVKEMNDWRKGKTGMSAIGSESKSRSRSRSRSKSRSKSPLKLKSSGGGRYSVGGKYSVGVRKTKKQRKKV